MTDPAHASDASPPDEPRGSRRILQRLLCAFVGVGLLGALGAWGERVSGGWFPPFTLAAQLAPVAFLAAVLGVGIAALTRSGRSVPLALRGAICGAAALAPMAIGPWLPTPFREASPIRALRILTANVGHARTDGEDVRALLLRADADVVCLQEIGPQHVDALEALRGNYPHQLLEPRGLQGMAFLSRLPAGDMRVVPGESRRPLMRATVEADGREVVIVNAHPSAWVAALGRLDDDARDMLALAEAASSGAPTVLAGDFNTTDRSWIHRRLLALGFTDAWDACGSGHGPTFPVFLRWRGLPCPPIVRIDHVLHTDELQAQAIEVGDDFGADHLPVIADLAWR